jgi:CHAT domain-containing protein
MKFVKYIILFFSGCLRFDCNTSCESANAAFVRKEIQSFLDTLQGKNPYALELLKQKLEAVRPKLCPQDTTIARLHHRIAYAYDGQLEGRPNPNDTAKQVIINNILFHYDTAFDIRRNLLGANHWLTAKTRFNRATAALFYQNKMVWAENELLQAKDLNEDYKRYEPTLKADILYQLADCSDGMGEWEAARTRAIQADSLYQQAHSFPMNYFNNCINLIQIYNDLNDNASVPLYERAMTHWETIPIERKKDEEVNWARLQFAHALSKRNQNDFKLFLNLMGQARKVFQEKGESWEIANTDIEIAKSYLIQKQYDKALKTALHALNDLQTLHYDKSHPSLIEVYTLLGDIDRENGKLKEAKKWYDEILGSINMPNHSITIYHLPALLGQSNLTQQPEIKHLIYGQINTLIQQTLNTFQTDFAKKQFLDKSRLAYEGAIQNAGQLYQRTSDIGYFEAILTFMNGQKSVFLSEMLRSEQLQKNLGIPDALLDKGRQLLSNLKAVYGDLQDITNVNAQQDYQKALMDYNTYKNDLFKSYPEYKSLKINTIQQNSLEQIRQNMPDQSAIVEYFWGQNELITAVITPEHQHVLTQPLTADLKKRIEMFRDSASNSKSNFDTMSSNAQHLYHYLLEKPLTLLKKQRFEPKSLIVIPDDVLSYLSFEALMVDAETFLVETETNISYEYSTQSWVENHQKESNSVKNPLQILALADDYRLNDDNSPKSVATLSKQLVSLNVMEHAQEMAKKFKYHQFIQTSLSSPNKILKNVRQTAILHFSGHGYSNDLSPSQSGVALSGQQMLMAKNVFAHRFPNLQLVYLMACQTHLGPYRRGEGVESFSRSFFYAGATRVVSSLWFIPDEFSKNITTDFYTNIQKKMPCNQALSAAKRSYLKAQQKNSNKHPAHWAGLVLTGNPNALKIN